MISTHTHTTKTQKKKYTHEVKSKKKQDAVSSWSKLAKKNKQEVVKKIRSSISRPHQVKSPRIPAPSRTPPPSPYPLAQTTCTHEPRPPPKRVRNNREWKSETGTEKQNCTKRKSLARNAITLTQTNTHVNILKEKQTAYIFSVRE